MNLALITLPPVAAGWLYLPAALVLGALHGLEPGHSKTMMAAFIVAVRGTMAQAALLGLAAAVSHSLIIWGLAALALHYGAQWNVEATEPYLQLGTGMLVMALALWTLWRIRRDRRGPARPDEHDHHDHAHNEPHDHADEPGEEHDAHAAAHAADIRRRFDGSRPVTTGQIILFGLTGGLMPCPAAFSVLLLCLQLKKFTLGFALVAAFSVGLAVTLVAVGVVAAWGASRIVKGSGRLGGLARNAPYFSSGLLILLGIVLVVRGASHLV